MAHQGAEQSTCPNTADAVRRGLVQLAPQRTLAADTPFGSGSVDGPEVPGITGKASDTRHQGHQIHEGAVARIVSPCSKRPLAAHDRSGDRRTTARSEHLPAHLLPPSGARSLACRASRRSTLCQKRCTLRCNTTIPLKPIDKRKALFCVATQGFLGVAAVSGCSRFRAQAGSFPSLRRAASSRSCSAF